MTSPHILPEESRAIVLSLPIGAVIAIEWQYGTNLKTRTIWKGVIRQRNGRCVLVDFENHPGVEMKIPSPDPSVQILGIREMIYSHPQPDTYPNESFYDRQLLRPLLLRISKPPPPPIVLETPPTEASPEEDPPGSPHANKMRALIKELTDEEILFLCEETQTKATKLYSVLQYTGEAWYLPKIEEAATSRYALSLDHKYHLVLSVGHRIMTINCISYLIRGLLLVLLWFSCWNMMPAGLSQLNGYVFDPLVLIIVSSIVGGLVCRVLQIPPLIGVLLMGLLWNNVPTVGYLTGGIHKNVSKVAQQSGLAIVLVRAGLSISKKTLVPVAKFFPMLAILPMLMEGIIHSLVAMTVFDFPSLWGFLQGFMCAPSSPAVIVPAVIYMGSLGYDLKLGPLMSASIGFDAGLGVWTINFILNLLANPNGIALAAGLGPVQIFGGIILGVVLGLLGWVIHRLVRSEADQLVTGSYTLAHLENVSFVLFLYVGLVAHGLIFYGYNMKIAGGAAIATVSMATTVANALLLSGNKQDENQKMMLSAKFISLWDLWTIPALFSMVGAQVIVMDLFAPDFFPKALACWAAGLAAKSLTAFGIFCLVPNVTWAERIFSAIAWCGKATVQAATATAPLLLFTEMVAAHPENAVFKDYLKYASISKKVSVLYIILGAPLASISYVRIMPYFMKKKARRTPTPKESHPQHRRLTCHLEVVWRNLTILSGIRLGGSLPILSGLRLGESLPMHLRNRPKESHPQHRRPKCHLEVGWRNPSSLSGLRLDESLPMHLG